MLVAELHSISEVPDSFYTGTIVLNDSLVTNYGKNLPFKQNMQGLAEIITEDLSLAERLLFPLKEVFKGIYRTFAIVKHQNPKKGIFRSKDSFFINLNPNL